MQSRQRTALVTGGSRGIGYELAKQFAAGGFDLVLVARSEGDLRAVAEELERDHGAEATVVTADLADPAAAADLYEEVVERDLTVDVLVNNAGFGASGAFTDTELDRELDMLQVNVVALTHLTKLFVRDMADRGTGKVLNVASTAAFQPGPLMAVYYASKAYVLSFSEALAEEFRGSGVTVTALCPGATETAFIERAEMGSTRLANSYLMDAETVAEEGYRATMRGEAVVIPGALNKLLTVLVRLLPRSTVRRVAKWVQS